MAKHHFVPVFYLGGFVDPVTPKGQTPSLWVGDAQSGTIARRAPRTVSRASGFYDWTMLPGLPSAENTLGVFENRAAPIFQRLRLGETGLGTEDRYHLANFLGFQIVRLPHFIDIVTQALQKHANRMLHEVLADDVALDAFRQAYGRQYQDPLTETNDEIRERIRSGHIEVRPTRDKSLSHSLELAFNFAELLFAMEWTVVVADDPAFFTTDQPLSLLTRDRTSPRLDFEGGDNKDLEAFISLSPERALVCHHGRLPTDGIVRMNGTMALELQWLTQLPTMKRFVYASSRDLVAWVLDQHRRCAPAWDLAGWPARHRTLNDGPNP